MVSKSFLMSSRVSRVKLVFLAFLRHLATSDVAFTLNVRLTSSLVTPSSMRCMESIFTCSKGSKPTIRNNLFSPVKPSYKHLITNQLLSLVNICNYLSGLCFPLAAI